ncbi:MAG: DUF2231 domain-containing protein [Hyphomonas sp.]
MAKHDEAHNADVGSRIAIAGHPIHVMLVTFPIALVTATLGADVFWWLTADPFFVRVGLWTSGWGFGMGVLASIAGTAELLAVRGIRRQPESWSHAVLALMMLSLAGANWIIRIEDAEAMILPWGGLLSLISFMFVGLAGWQGGKLVFEHQIGIILNDPKEDES